MHGDVATAPRDGGPWGGGDYHAPRPVTRTAADVAAFLPSNLQPGMRMVDAGCGHGTIALGWAD